MSERAHRAFKYKELSAVVATKQASLRCSRVMLQNGGCPHVC